MARMTKKNPVKPGAKKLGVTGMTRTARSVGKKISNAGKKTVKSPAKRK